ncbi:MAG: exonuclease subunit SbcD [Prevotella sp.]|nr:exonuclease subunit SbcD [Prevotella sp.]
MKILHTSDWHLGHTLYNFSREEEYADMLRQMTRIVEKEKPDAFVISGDVYDTMQPSASVQTMLANALVDIHHANPDMKIVCIAGNHDSGSRHTIYRTPWKALGVEMVGNISRDSRLEDYIFKVEGKGYIVAVPFAADRFMPEDVFVRLQEMVAEMNKEEQLPVFLSAHLAVARCDYRGHDMSTDENIGGLGCQELNVFGEGYDYIALGHIHKYQKLDTDGRIYYCGTPIAMSFDEVYRGNRHCVMLVECGAHGAIPQVTPLEINNPRPLVNIPQEGFAEWEEVKREFTNYPDNIPSYIRLNVEVENYLTSGANDEASMIASEKDCRFCIINAKRKESVQKEKERQVFTTSEFKQLDTTDVARMWIESKGDTFDDEMKEIIEEVKREIVGS